MGIHCSDSLHNYLPIFKTEQLRWLKFSTNWAYLCWLAGDTECNETAPIKQACPDLGQVNKIKQKIINICSLSLFFVTGTKSAGIMELQTHTHSLSSLLVDEEGWSQATGCVIGLSFLHCFDAAVWMTIRASGPKLICCTYTQRYCSGISGWRKVRGNPLT